MAYANTTTGKKLSPAKEKEILDLLDDYFQTDLTDPAWKEAREEMVKCIDYKENRQWTKAELKDLADRGQPPTVNNQVKVTIDRIVGQFVEIRTRTAYKPRNQAPDTPVAQAMEDIYSYIKQCSGLEFEERDVMEDGATCGFGVFEVCIEDSEDGKDQEVIVKAEDCLNILPDTRSKRYDWNSDGRRIHRFKWVDRDYLSDIYPKQKAKVEGLFKETGVTDLANVDKLRGETYLDYKRERVRLIETQYKKFIDEEIYEFSDGKTIEGDKVSDELLEMAKEAGVAWEVKTERNERICIGVWTGGVLFEHGVSKRKRFSFVPFFVNRKKNGAPYSLITTALPIQDAINKRESKALALLTMNQARYERGAVDDKGELGVQMVKPDGQIEINEGFFEKFEMDKNLELANSQNQMHVQAKMDFRAVTGVNPDALGEKSEVRSGVGIQRKIAMTGLVIAPIFDNFRRTREALAKTIHDAVCVAYTEKKILNITDNPKVSRTVALDKNLLDAVKQAHYDIIVTEEEDYDTIHEQQMDILSKSLPQMLQFGPGWAEVMLEMSTIRNKEELLAKVQQVTQQNQKPDEPNISFSAQLDKLSVPERLFIYQKMGAPPQLLQQIMQAAPPPTQVLDVQQKAQQNQIEAQAEVQKTATAAQGEALKAHTERQKAQTAQVKGQMDLAKSQMDIEAKRHEVALKGQEHAMKLQVEREKGAMQQQQQAQQLDLQRQQGEQQLQHAERQHRMDLKAKAAQPKAKEKA